MNAIAEKHLGCFHLSDGHAPPPSRGKQPGRVRKAAGLGPMLAAADVANQATGQEIAGKVVSREVVHHTDNQTLPPLISRFLETHWRSYMMRLYVVDGEQSDAWCSARKNTNKLIWSVQPKLDDESRHQLYLLLPELFQWLHALLESQRVFGHEEDDFFAELASLQVAALQWDANGASGSAPVTTPKSVPDVDPEVKQAGSAPIAIDMEGGKPGAAQPASGRAVVAKDGESGALQALVIGSSVALHSERASKRVLHLEWISRSGGVYFFRDQKRGDALCLTAERCIHFFREGLAHVY